ncbi:hypothetical protein OV207_36665 [Corallococcus sp. BB11-1]|uniref:ORC-CDC6 family AAA ATPase n=1 Tax=Corallococcus sp. BB11-1 TaxID=2996783 RepID=UPI00226F401E|nr:hypothetical protein [Corallococcus sp. BB11-1]MCY1037022.1 hypothetical protein [Corallococcus sp. BB11-1]
MKDVRNPFRLQTAESIDSDADFLRLFGHGVLDLLPDDALSGRPLFIRSAPGGGKTSLLKLFTPSVLQHLVAMKTNDATKDLFIKLKGLGAVSDHGANILSVMLPCARTFPALADVGLNPARAKRLLLALIDARVILGALRAILVIRGLRFPDDLGRLSLVAPPDDIIPGLTFPAEGVTVQRWAELIEQRVADLIDTLMSPDGSGPSGHDALLSLRLLDANCIHFDGKPFETRWLITFDDMQKLAPSQRSALLEVVVDQRSRSTVWLAERFEALANEELLANGVLSGRDHLVIALEREWKKGKFEPAVKLIAERRARMAAESAGTNAPDAFAPTIEADLEAPAWQEKTQAALSVVRRRVEALAAAKPQYADWVKSRVEIDGSLRHQLIKWRTLEILIARHAGKPQQNLFPELLSAKDLDDKEEASERGAAELFLSKEFGFPYYFGLSRLASLGSFNVEQFIRLAGDLFEESLAAAVMRRPTSLSPQRQERIIKDAFDERMKDLPRRARNGRAALNFLDAIGHFCREETYQPNAPYAPGVTGFSLSMADCSSLYDPDTRKTRPDFAAFGDVLTTALQYNLLLPDVDRPRPSGRVVVLYLNRLVCAKYDLPLHYGGFREKRLQDVMTWPTLGFRPSRQERLLI